MLEEILKKYNITNYKIREDNTVDVMGDVILINLKLTQIPIKFGVVHGDFQCSRNNLTTLKNCPTHVRGYFHVGWNNLTTLEDGPVIVVGDYYVYENPLITNFSKTKCGGFHTYLKEDGMNFINDSYVCGNYNEWCRLYKRKKIFNKIIK